MSEKLHKVLASYGCGSRREMERWIQAGRVVVNGKPAHLGQRVQEVDVIKLDGKLLKRVQGAVQHTRVLLYHKPEGEVCTRSDEKGRATIFEHLPHLKVGRWITVGRLDYKTTGLLLVTNSGDLAHRLMHPSSGLEREYLVRVYGDVSEQILDRLHQGVMLEDGKGQFKRIEAQGPEASNRWFRVVVTQGRNLFVRRMWMSQGLTVTRLKRVRFGPLLLPKNLSSRQFIELPSADCHQLAHIMSSK